MVWVLISNNLHFKWNSLPIPLKSLIIIKRAYAGARAS